MNRKIGFGLILGVVALGAISFIIGNHDKKVESFDNIHNTFTVRNDLGGFTYKYWELATKFHENGTRIIIDGRCISACTFFLVDEKACVTDNAVLGFHAMTENVGTLEHPVMGKEINKGATEEQFSVYPVQVQNFIKKNGGLTLDTMYLAPPELFQVVPKCDELLLRGRQG
jgi:hypothetical protein